jgi:hypothetical protein
MPDTIRLKITHRIVEAELNDSETARMLLELLPITISMQRWGEEYYGDCGLNVSPSRNARQDMEIGELAIWPAGNALCIFFGPTPASIGEKPRAVSPVNPVGRLRGDVSFLKGLPGSISVEVEK